MKFKHLLSKILPTHLVDVASDAGNKGLLENLESRVMMSVTQDAAGWTVVTPSADSKLIHVSSSSGSDTNDGSVNAPVKTLAKAMTMVRANMPDHILLKRGDTWTGESFYGWHGSGRSAQEPMLISAYGTGAKPVVAPGAKGAGWISHGNNVINHLYIMGVHFIGEGRAGGIDRLSPGTNFHIEDVKIEKFNVNIAVQGYYSYISNMTIRRSQILDAYPGGTGHSQGMYIHKTTGTLIEETVVDHSGWRNQDRSDATIFNHGVYMSGWNDGTVIRRNIFANNSSHGLQMRGGGILQDNLFVNNPIGFSFGLVNGSDLHPGGVTGSISGNVVINSSDINVNTARGWAAEIANIKPGGFSMRDNIFANNNSVGDHAAIKLILPSGPNNPYDAVGIHDLTIENNIVYRWKSMLFMDSQYSWGGTGWKNITNLTVRNNQFQGNLTNAPMILHDMPINLSQERWENNTYWDSRPDSNWFRIQNIGTSLADWKAKVEPTAKVQQLNYADPLRSVGSYNASIGGLGTYAAFMAEVRSESRGNWRGAYHAPAILDYIRKGFATGPSTNPSVSISAGAAAAEGSSTPGTFTVTRSGATTSALTLAYTVSGTATNGVDYSTLAGTVTIPAGSSSATINVYAIDDASYDPNEAVTLSLVPGAGYDVAAAVASIAVTNNDPAPLPHITAVAGLNVEEAKAGVSGGTFVLTRSGDLSSPLTVNYLLEGTATAGLDYVLPAGTITFAAGSATATLTIMGLDDQLVESGEKIDLVLLPGTGYTHASTKPSINVLDDGDVAPDTTAPTATAALNNISIGGGTMTQFTVTYRDNVAVNANTLGSTDLIVTGPNGFTQAASLVGMQVVENGAAAIATYRISAPGGQWNAADNGTYTLVLNSGEVRDAAGSSVTAGSFAAFAVGITDPAPVNDTTAPTAVITTSNVTTTGGNTYRFNVTYSDNVAVDVSTLGDDDIGVVFPGGITYLARLVTVDLNSNGNVRNATYEILAPGGSWDAADAGTYGVSSLANGVYDTSGNGVTGTAGAIFTASFPGLDSKPTVAVGGHGESGGEEIFFTVTYGGSNPILVESLDNEDLLVVGPQNFEQAARLVSVMHGVGNEVVATYAIAAPDGTWDSSEDGLYTVSMLPSAVSTKMGVYAATGEVGTLLMDADGNLGELPEVTVTASDPSVAEGGDITFTFTRSGDLSGTLVAAFKLTGTAVNGIDYGGLGNAVWFAAGEDTVTVKMSSLDDRAVEPAESMTLTLAGMATYTIGTATASVTIADNDVDAPIPATRFSDTRHGDLNSLSPLNGERWTVVMEGGDRRLFLNTSEYQNFSGSRLGEYALAKGQTFGDFVLSVKAKSAENFSNNPISDFAVVLGYVDGNNYAYMMFNTLASETQLFVVSNGMRQSLATASKPGIPDNNYHDIAIARVGNTVIVKLDGQVLLQATDSRLGRVGYTGVGSFNDSAYFDELNVQAIAGLSAQPMSVQHSATSGSSSPSSDASLNNTFNSSPVSVLN